MEGTKHDSPYKMSVAAEKGKVPFFFLLFVALVGFMILTGLELFVKSTVSALLNVTKSFLFNFENFTILNSTAVHDFEKKYANNI